LQVRQTKTELSNDIDSSFVKWILKSSFEPHNSHLEPLLSFNLWSITLIL
jgi:hypothetical protein